MEQQRPIRLLDSRGQPVAANTERPNKRLLPRSKRLLLSTIAIVTTVTVFASNLDQVAALVKKVTNPAARRPILLRYHVYHTDGNDAERKLVTDIREEGSSLLDITLSYEGAEKIIFDRISIRHQSGMCASMPSGQLISAAKYKCAFEYDSSTTCHIEPPLVINPSVASLLRFEMEVAPIGQTSSACGDVWATLGYRAGSGDQGELPLIHEEN